MKNLFLNVLLTLAVVLASLSWSASVTGTSLTETTDNILYVKPDAAGVTCVDWDHACGLQTALGLAVDGDEIWVAEGTYYPGLMGNRYATFQLKSGVEIYGGFAGTETQRDERDWNAHPTILSGDIDRDDLLDDGNAYNVVTGSGVDETALLDGFAITGGYADGESPHEKGGGMYNNNGSPALTNVTLSGNAANNAGGGMYNEGSSPTLTDVTISGNSAEVGDGGGMYNVSSSPELTDVTISGNSAEIGDGGGIYSEESSPLLTNVTLSSNSANYAGGGMYNYWNSNPTLTNVTLSDNVAGENGGGMHNYENSNPMLINVTISGNSTVKYGGGMYNEGSSPTLINVTISGNSAKIDDIGDGGGMYNYNNSNPTLINAIIWGNTPDQMDNFDSSEPIISYSDIQGGCPVEATCTEVIDADPLLGALADNGGSTLTHALTPGSPAIDAGTNVGCPTTDQRGLPRPNDGDLDGEAICDIGAYEFDLFYVFLPLVRAH